MPQRPGGQLTGKPPQQPSDSPSNPSKGSSGSKAPDVPKVPQVPAAEKAAQCSDAGDSPLTVTISRTLYFGNLYEQALTDDNDTTPTYINYYYLGGNGGKLVGMRRVNQDWGNGQQRIVGDHLGSTSVILDTPTGGGLVTVLQRQYHKPYGEKAYAYGTDYTSIEYTGQRSDADTGTSLMYYGARYYDPVLAYFVSADTIAPDPTDPKTRNRYSYVLNNPLKYNDPSGHCEDDPNNPEYAEGMSCSEAENELRRYGLRIDYIGDWQLWQLREIIAAVERMLSKFDWTVEDFRYAMKIDVEGDIWLYQNVDGKGSGYGGQSQPKGFTGAGAKDPTRRNIVIEDTARTARGPDPANPYDFASTFVHELAHAWDSAWGGALSDAMAAKTGSGPDAAGNYQAGGYAASEDGKADKGQDWAEAVAGYVYPEDPKYQPVWEEGERGGRNRQVGMDGTRRQHVRDMAAVMKSLAHFGQGR